MNAATPILERLISFIIQKGPKPFFRRLLYWTNSKSFIMLYRAEGFSITDPEVTALAALMVQVMGNKLCWEGLASLEEYTKAPEIPAFQALLQDAHKDQDLKEKLGVVEAGEVIAEVSATDP